jgi:threonine/homoserine/homoserine lactone efflux protein
VAHSRRHGLLAAAGVVIASLVWVAFSLAGLGILLLDAGWLYRLLRLLGAAYLVYVGCRLMLQSFRQPLPEESASTVAMPAGRPFLRGLMTTLSNPKSAVFWTSLFTVSVPPEAPAWFYAALLAIVAIQSTLWYASVALFLSTATARRLYRPVGRWLDRITGAVMVALGLRLAWQVRAELAR